MTQNRRRQRRFAFQVIYSLNFFQTRSKEDLVRSFDNFWREEEFDMDRETSYAWTLVEGVFDNHAGIDEVIRAACRLVKPAMRGRAELEVAWELESYMRTRGATALSFEPIVAYGANGAIPHATLRDVPLLTVSGSPRPPTDARTGCWRRAGRLRGRSSCAGPGWP